MRDASLICPPGIEGIIVGVKIFSRKGIEKDDRAKAIEQEELDMMEKNLQDEIRILHDEVKKRVIMMLQGQKLRADLFDEYGRERLLKKGTDADAGGAAGDALRAMVRAEDRRPTIRGSRTTCAISRSAPSARSKSSASSSRRRRRRSAAATSCRRASSSWSRSTSR